MRCYCRLRAFAVAARPVSVTKVDIKPPARLSRVPATSIRVCCQPRTVSVATSQSPNHSVTLPSSLLLLLFELWMLCPSFQKLSRPCVADLVTVCFARPTCCGVNLATNAAAMRAVNLYAPAVTTAFKLPTKHRFCEI